MERQRSAFRMCGVVGEARPRRAKLRLRSNTNVTRVAAFGVIPSGEEDVNKASALCATESIFRDLDRGVAPQHEEGAGIHEAAKRRAPHGNHKYSRLQGRCRYLPVAVLPIGRHEPNLTHLSALTLARSGVHAAVACFKSDRYHSPVLLSQPDQS